MGMRIKNFSETSGFNKKQAIAEATRCPQPANSENFNVCPLGIDVLGFVRLIREGDIAGALSKIREKNHLPGVCSRVCSAPCEKSFKDQLYIRIRALERFAFDNGQKIFSKKISIPSKNKRVAVIGSGPVGLTAAGDLAQLGYQVVVFEARPLPGGVLRYQAPEFKLPAKILDSEITYLKSFGVQIQTNALVGSVVSVKELFDQGFAAIFLAAGQGISQSKNIPGENSRGVLSAREYLLRSRLSQNNGSKSESLLSESKNVVIVGRGTEALDSARTALRFGKNAALIFERGEDELAVLGEEIALAKEEGLRLEVFARVLEILANDQNHVKAIKCIKMDFADPGSSGEWKLIPVAGSEFTLEADTVVLASTYHPNTALVKATLELKTHKDNSLLIKKDSFATSWPGVFAVPYGEHEMVEHMASAKKCVLEIDKYIQAKA